MKDVLSDVTRLRERGERFAIATVVASKRTAPRPIGSKLVVAEGGAIAGSVSGGCVEGDVATNAEAVLGGAPAGVQRYGIEDELAFSVGLSCGGEIEVFINEPDLALVDRVATALRRQERAVWLTVLDGPEAGAQALLTRDGERTGAEIAGAEAHVERLLREDANQVLELDGRRAFAEVLGPPPRVVVVGAVDTAEALCRAAKNLGWRTVVVDARTAFATPERMPSADELVTRWPQEALPALALDDQTAVVVLTHDEKFDIPALVEAVRTDACYIGAIGARRTQERRRARLLEEGLDEAALARISGPCGLDVGAVTPAETAVSILGEILAVRAGRAGGRLRDAKGSIKNRPGGSEAMRAAPGATEERST